LRVALVEIADRGPVNLAVPAVDFADQRRKLRLQLTIGLDRAPRRHGELQVGNAALVRGLRRQQAVERAHPVREAFRVIHAIGADGEFRTLQTRAQAYDSLTRG